MITVQEERDAREQAVKLFSAAGLLITEAERNQIEVVDFGLSELRSQGAQILTLVQTERISVKILALLPLQTEPEHWHPPVGADPGKEETVRHVYGDLYFYLEGANTMRHGCLPGGSEAYFTCRNEIVMEAGQQLTCRPGTKHWFQAGPRGAVLYSFSTVARDALDEFSDPRVVRTTRVVDSR